MSQKIPVILVRFPEGEQIQMTLNPEQQVQAVLNKLEQKGIVNRYFMFNDEVLPRDKTFADYDVRAGDSLFLVQNSTTKITFFGKGVLTEPASIEVNDDLFLYEIREMLAEQVQLKPPFLHFFVQGEEVAADQSVVSLKKNYPEDYAEIEVTLYIPLTVSLPSAQTKNLKLPINTTFAELRSNCANLAGLVDDQIILNYNGKPCNLEQEIQFVVDNVDIPVEVKMAIDGGLSMQ